jgi:NAD(P)-dependent dehydrogenase (short-subunit alcohol dehydrogenase family)
VHHGGRRSEAQLAAHTAIRDSSVMDTAPPRPAALVTGGGRGIGLAACRALLAAGHEVWAVSRTRADLDAAIEAVGDPAFHAVSLDVRDEAGIDALVSDIARDRPLRALVAAHGVYPPAASVLDTTVDAFRDVTDINLVGSFVVARAGARAMRDAGGGAIVLVGSANGLAGEHGTVGYNASKAAIHSLAQSFAIDLADYGVRVVAVAPGWVRTAMTEESLTPELLDGRGRYNAQRRIAEPAEVAELIAWLCSPAASYVTGCTIPIDGGQMAEAPGPWK